MNRDQLAALARCAVTLLAGAAMFYAVAQWLGWWWAGAIVISGLADTAWCVSRAFIRRMQRLTAQQRERERVELGYRDHGGEG